MTSLLKKNGQRVLTEEHKLEDTHEINGHCISSNTKKENKWRQQFLAELSVLHHYIKGMTINTYIMKSNIQNFRDKYIIYSLICYKISLSERKCVFEQKNDNELLYSYVSMDFNFSFLMFFLSCWSKRTWKRQMYKYLAQVWQYHNSLQFYNHI